MSEEETCQTCLFWKVIAKQGYCSEKFHQEVANEVEQFRLEYPLERTPDFPACDKWVNKNV